MELRVRPAATSQDLARAAAFLEARAMRTVARLGELVDPLAGQVLLAEDPSGRLLGVLTYQVVGTDLEVSTLYAAVSGSGVGTALLSWAEDEARRFGARRLWLITTNDNLDALGFYQRRGFRLVALRVGAVDDARDRLKPTIPPVGDHGIPIHDELVLERWLDAQG